jgi:menaquinone-dependent protoporphyrinogen oxidase
MKALVAFGTKYGSTVQVAETIASELRGRGYRVDLADLRQNHRVALDGYDLVVVGSSVLMGRWTKGAQEFLRKNAAQLTS